MAERRYLFRHQQVDVLIGMGLAGLVNASMLIIAAALFFGTDVPDTDTLEGVHAGLARVLDQPAAFPSRWPCWRPGSPRPESAPTPGRS